MRDNVTFLKMLSPNVASKCRTASRDAVRRKQITSPALCKVTLLIVFTFSMYEWLHPCKLIGDQNKKLMVFV